MVLKEKHSGKFYRGASIGYGDKTDFVHKGSPGIGKYKLPSIWDRYWMAVVWLMRIFLFFKFIEIKIQMKSDKDDFYGQ